jgi:hypothetical protein
MTTGIQTAEVINNLDRLNLEDVGVELPRVESGLLTPTYTIDPAWVSLEHSSGTNLATSINGTIVNMDDVGMQVQQGPSLTVGIQRYWSNCQIRLVGGTVNPMEIYVASTFGGSSTVFLVLTMPNPGRVNIGPFLMGLGTTHRVSNGALGGAGDTMFVTRIGITAASGVPIPLVDRATVTTMSAVP